MIFYQGRIDPQGKKSVYRINDTLNLEHVVLHVRFASSAHGRYDWGQSNVITIATAWAILEDQFTENIAQKYSSKLATDVFKKLPENKWWTITQQDIYQYIVAGIIPPFDIGTNSIKLLIQQLSDILKEKVLSENYTINVNDDGIQFLYCKLCKKVSYHKVDISERYCGNCRTFLEK